MSIASDLLEQHLQTLVDDNARWQTLIADDVFGNSRMHRPSAIQQSCPEERKLSGTQRGSLGLLRTSVSSTSRCMPSPIRKAQSPR